LQAPQPPAQPPLQASPGEFVGVPVFRVLDTRNGTGEPGPAKLRLTSGSSVIAKLAPAGHTESVWAAGFTAHDGLIALDRPVPNKAGRAGL
jgi:hypothetical protein